MRISDWSSDVCASDLAAPAIAEARDQIRIVGSSTVFPYTQAASEEFANKSGFSAPVVESTGTGGGMKIFCQGIGADHADITGARSDGRPVGKECVSKCRSMWLSDL